jgi:hypothetical protein
MKYEAEFNIVVTTMIEADSHEKASEIAIDLDLRALLSGENIPNVTEDQYVPELVEVKEEE